MVNRFRAAPPAISFGFGRTELTAGPGETVTVWLGTLYNLDEYSFVLQAGAEAKAEALSGFEYTISFGMRGSYTITLEVISNDKKISLKSNEITLTIE